MDEPIFDVLPETVLSNFHTPRSENALVWNLIYPLAQPTISYKQLVQIRPLWGVVMQPDVDEELRPYFWGFDVRGKRLPGLDDALEWVDGEGPRTEVDLFLLGQTNLIVIEAKNLSALGRCSRYAAGRCPEIHSDPGDPETACRYWDLPQVAFSAELDFGERPCPGQDAPPCERHYQLARTLLVGRELSRRLDTKLSIWMMIPRTHWRALEKAWLDLTERVQDDVLWRRMRVLAWEDVERLGRMM